MHISLENVFLYDTYFIQILQEVLLSFRHRFPDVRVPNTKGNPKISLQRTYFNLNGD